MAFRVEHIDHVALTVRDVPRSVAWYRDVLGLERRYEDAWGDEPAVVCAGDTCLALFPASVPSPAATPGPDTIAMRHVAFAVSRDGLEAARRRFAGLGIEAREEDHGISRSLYIADPDGHRVEVTTYET